MSKIKIAELPKKGVTADKNVKKPVSKKKTLLGFEVRG